MRLENSMFRQHTGSQYTVMISKPPRPPSWRDFVPPEPQAAPPKPVPHSSGKTSKTSVPTSSSSKRGSKDLEFSNLSRIQQKSYSEGSDLSRLGIGGQPLYHGSHQNLHRGHHRDSGGIGHSQTLPNPHPRSSRRQQQHHRSQGRLHRTTSQYNIEQADIPRIESMTMSLANTKLQKKGGPGFHPLIYLDENAKRCERWLQEVHASHPLEDVAGPSTKASSTSTSSPGQLLIPEMGLDEQELVKSPGDLCSGSGSEVDSVSVCAAQRLDLSDKEREAHIRLPGGGGGVSGGSMYPHHNPQSHPTPPIIYHPLLKTDNSPTAPHKPHTSFLNSFRPKCPPPSDLKDVIEESSSSCFSSVQNSPLLPSQNNNRLRVVQSKENRDPSSAVSSSSEELIQQRNNRKNVSEERKSVWDREERKNLSEERKYAWEESKNVSEERKNVSEDIGESPRESGGYVERGRESGDFDRGGQSTRESENVDRARESGYVERGRETLYESTVGINEIKLTVNR